MKKHTKKPQPFTHADAKKQLSDRWRHAEVEHITNSSQRGDITSWAKGTTSFKRPLCDGPMAPAIRTAAFNPAKARAEAALSTPRQFVEAPPIDCPKFSSEGSMKTTPGQLADSRVAISDRINSFYESLGKVPARVREF